MAIQFPNLEQAMRDSGFGRETVDTALAWLDISKERDTALLKKLTVQDSKINQNKKPVYHIAFRQDVIPHGSEELYRRIILMSYQLLDAEACIMTGPLFHEIPDMKFDAFQKLTDDTMQEVWGDEAQARSFAMRYAMYTLRTGITNADLPAEHTPYLKAADLTSDKGTAGDGAMIDDFLREDIFVRNNGIRAVLTHSGMSVEVFRSEAVDVTIDKLYFYKLPAGDRMTVKELKDRYFSEILYRLSMVFLCE